MAASSHYCTSTHFVEHTSAVTSTRIKQLSNGLARELIRPFQTFFRFTTRLIKALPVNKHAHNSVAAFGNYFFCHFFVKALVNVK